MDNDEFEDANAGGDNANNDAHVDAANSATIPRIPLPTLTDTTIDVYFMSLEFWFEASNVKSDSRKYNTVMASVPPSKLTELRAIIEACPANGKYEYAKAKLTEHFAESQQRRLKRVMQDAQLDDKKPSQLFNEMKRMAGATLSETVLLDLWAARLPTHAQSAVVASTGDAAERTKIADAIVELLSLRTGSVNEAQSAPVAQPAAAQQPTRQYHDSLASMNDFRNELQAMFEEAKTKWFNRRPSLSDTSRNRSAPRRRSESRPPTTDDMCWYHKTFGDNARKCREGCRKQQPAASTSTQQ